jgi:hypothetical protein
MTTLKKLLILLTIIPTLNSYSQEVVILKKADLKNLPVSKTFAYIEPTIDTSQTKFVATILAKDDYRNTSIESLYFEILKQANKLGANCFKLKSFSRDTLKFSVNHLTVLTLDCYYISDTALFRNTSNHEKNVVYFFGKEKKTDKPISFYINGEKKEIKSGTYYKIALEEGNELNVTKGGVIGGTKLWLKWASDKQPAFYTLSGFGVSASNDPSFSPNNGYYNGGGISFKTGSISQITNINLGLLLVQILGKNKT